MKRLILFSFVVLASLVAVPSALSGKPTFERTEVDLTIPDTVDCAFPVEVRIVGTDTAITRTIGGDVHEFHSFGGGHATVTNLLTHASVTVNIAGPGHLTFGADGSFKIVGTGTSIFFFEDTPGITWVLGKWTFAVDAGGHESSSVIGTTRDLCAAVA